jgi:hypothetical protein
MRNEAKVLVASLLMKGRTSAALSSGQSFNPVAGLLLIQLISLGASIAPMYKKIPGIQKYLVEVYARAHDFAKSHPTLNVETIAAILMYTMEDSSGSGAQFYTKLNEALRLRIRLRSKPFFPYLRLILNALKALPHFSGVVYRGISGVDLREQFPINTSVRAWELMSVSEKKSVAMRFAAQGSEPLQTLLVITTFRVAQIAQFSNFEGECECLFFPGTQFKATKYEQEDSCVIIHLHHIDEDLDVLLT